MRRSYCVNTKLVDSLLETVFFGGEEGGLEDQPRPRFKWTPPAGAGPAGDMGDLSDIGDYADAPIPPRGSITNVPSAKPPGAAKEYYKFGKPAVPPPPAEDAPLDDRTGKYSMDELIPKSEVATTDDLLDFFNRMKKHKGKGKKAMQREFDVRKPDFESLVNKFVDMLLTEAVCDMCGEEVGDQWMADRGASGKKTVICGKCYVSKDSRGEKIGGYGPDRFEAPEYTGTGMFPRR